MALSRITGPVRSFIKPLALGAVALFAASYATPTRAGEPPVCLSQDPTKWPAPSKPYFMIVVDNSGSMGEPYPANLGANSCGFPQNKIGHARCAVKNTVEAYGGEVNFGLATYAWRLINCPAGDTVCGACDNAKSPSCYPECGKQYAPTDDNTCGPKIAEPNFPASPPGPAPPKNNLIHAGANIAVPLLQDHYWMAPPDASNLNSILALVDNNCTNGELGADSNTPLGGVLFDMNRYFSNTFTSPFAPFAAVPTPLGTLAEGERGCRSVNVILITDGDETCDTYDAVNHPGGEGLAVFEAGRLFNPGVAFGGQTFAVKTYVIGFGGSVNTIALNNIASAGGTKTAFSTSNEVSLAQSLSKIISQAIQPESCDNTDNNCNGCTDEGFSHYCDVQQTCCNLARATCLANYQASITAQNPNGDVTLLPCTTIASQADPTGWLCFNPGDVCDGVDNNCNALIDENDVKCGMPLHCPQAEICDGLDNNCNGLIDEGNVCGVNCHKTQEVCDGCDNDCNGIVDDGIAAIPCGSMNPPNCSGTIVCKSSGIMVAPGGCVQGGGFSACQNNPQAETCDGVDNNCNGIIDDGVPSVPCVPVGTPNGLVYGGTSQCQKGHTVCTNAMTTCVGFVGPGPEVCDGVDNNCDGQVDNGVPGTGQMCGINQAPCSPGLTACVNGALVCQGGVQPSPEVCDGIDNNCDGKVDNAPLADGPAQGQNGCWDLPGNCCSFSGAINTLNWCPPAGATCVGDGTLTPPCQQGTLSCHGAAGWVCSKPVDPGAETCDGVDNNCNGQIDEGNPGGGQVCGSDVGQCKTGITLCQNGSLVCVGSVGPMQETCNNKDDDCDGQIDNGIPSMGACDPVYDMVKYPGPRNLKASPCHQGDLECHAGVFVCTGGQGPQPEQCDGVDNDCDGKIDEAGPAPDGIDGSANPFPPPDANIGDGCGVNVGQCKGGQYACFNGAFACLGGQAPQPESCDCLDNNCDGKVDNSPPNGPPICGDASQSCVSYMGQCQCAVSCTPHEFACPVGQVCTKVKVSGTGADAGFRCVIDPNAACMGDCSMSTVTDKMGNVVCAPKGTVLANCLVPPTCVCKGAAGCQDPCNGVTCTPGQVCAESGPDAGKCVTDSCFNSPCQGCGKVCDNGTCKDDPCKPDSCPKNEECKPKAGFGGFDCVKSCAGVTCGAGKVCADGACVKTCEPACAAGKTCDLLKGAPTCVADMCAGKSCNNAACCDPITGACGACPCEGVICPAGQACSNATGQCAPHGGTGGGGAGGSGAGGAATTVTTSGPGSTTGATTGSGGAGGKDSSIWGLATGGGGCACELGPVSVPAEGRLGLVAAAVALGLRRRKRRPAGSAAELAGKEVSS